MGLLDMLGYGQSPFGQWFDQNRGKVTGAFGGLAGAGNDPRAALQGFVGGLQHGVSIDDENAIIRQQQADAKAKADAEAAKQQAQIDWLQKNAPQYAGMVQAGVLDPNKVGELLTKPDASTAADPSDVATYKFYANQELKAGRPPMSFADWRKGGNQTPKAGLGTPLPYRDKDGNWHAVEPMTDGTAVDLGTGNAPDASLIYDPFGFAGGKTGTIVDAKTSANARQALPGAEQAYSITQQALSNFDPNNNDPTAQSVRAGEDENFAKLFGFVPNQMINVIVPGSNRANFRNIVDQLSGDAFLQIRQALKGAGQVTDFEGQKGEIALSRMKAAVQSGDDAAFKQSLLDFQTAIENGLALLRKQAQGSYAGADSPAVAGPPGGVTDMGNGITIQEVP